MASVSVGSSACANRLAFEAAICTYMSASGAFALTSELSAFQLALKANAIVAGDVVMLSALCSPSSLSAVVALGAVPAFVDVEPRFGTIDVALVAEYLARPDREHKRPSVVIANHAYGQPCDVASLAAVCEEADVRLIEDAVDAVGTMCTGGPAGATAPCGILGFDEEKIVSAMGGSMLVIRNKAGCRVEPEDRMSDVLAGMGRAQLSFLPATVDARRQVASHYGTTLAEVGGVELQADTPWGMSNRWLSIAIIDESLHRSSAADVARALACDGIESRPVRVPAFRQTMFKDVTILGGEIAMALSRTALCLPSSSALTAGNREEVVSCIARALAGAGRS
ncbi:MAG: DegT/DnrJ/EryC1/StrS aminotransferase [Gemmatimonadetes bacterium]|nr:DegT/DnrJ/EryC1/StrS aminotransferase [Gemmatimonadota bacterium]